MSQVTKLNDKSLRETMRSLYTVLIQEPENKDKFDEFCQVYENHKSRRSFFANLSLQSSDYNLIRDTSKKNSKLAKFIMLNGISSERVWDTDTFCFIMELPKNEFLSNEIVSYLKDCIKNPQEKIGDIKYFIGLLKTKILNEIYNELTDEQKIIKFLELIEYGINVFLEEYPELFLLEPKMREIIVSRLKNGEIELSEKLLGKSLSRSISTNYDHNDVYASVVNIAIESGKLAKYSDAVKVAILRPDLFHLCENSRKLSLYKWMKIFSYYDENRRGEYSEDTKMSIKKVFSNFDLYMMRALPDNLRTIERLVEDGYIEAVDVVAAVEPKAINYLNYHLNELTIFEVLIIAKHNISKIRVHTSGGWTEFYIQDENKGELSLSRHYISNYDNEMKDVNWKIYFLSNFFEFSKNQEFTVFFLSKISLRTAYQLAMLNDSNTALKNLIISLIEDKKFR